METYDKQAEGGKYFRIKIEHSNTKDQGPRFSSLIKQSILLKTYRANSVLDSHGMLNSITIQSTKDTPGFGVKKALFLVFEDDFEVIEDL